MKNFILALAWTLLPLIGMAIGIEYENAAIALIGILGGCGLAILFDKFLVRCTGSNNDDSI